MNSQTSDSEFQHGIVLFDFVAWGGGAGGDDGCLDLSDSKDEA